jgi:hypothetical protein
MLLLFFIAVNLMFWAMPRENNAVILLSNLLVFIGGIWFVKMAKRYYRCPVCDKVVVPTKDDGTPSEISFAIAFKPTECPYCKTALR